MRVSVHGIVLAVLAAVVLVAVAPEANSAAGTPITVCNQTVTTNAYLTQDLTCDSIGFGIRVGASGITIDLRGFTLQNALGGVSAPGGIYAPGYNDVTIKNGVVARFHGGISMTGNGIRISGVTVIADPSGAEGGITITGDSATVMSSVVAGGVGDGIKITGDSATITSSGAHGNAGNGITVIGDEFAIKSAAATGNGDNGFNLWPTGEGTSSVKSSTATGNALDGIFVNFANGMKFTGNQANGNGFPLRDMNGRGIFVSTYTNDDPPTGKNTARGNDSPQQCVPDYLCP